MKNLFLILAFAFSAALMAPSVGFSQAADDSKRTVNPGEDPNEARTGSPLRQMLQLLEFVLSVSHA
ncbi:hypothetical protein BDW_00455 [Bdellovibrio bacteriovorus W]|nr:hypothetical protein BDW_00455 [Bdellovibrio bacteriovorus W]